MDHLRKLTLLGTLVICGCQESPTVDSKRPKKSQESPALRLLIDELKQAGRLDTDANFKKLRSHRFARATVAPAALRELLTNWDRAGRPRVDADYRFENGRVTLSWHASMQIPEEYEVARPRLLKQLQASGLKVVEELESSALKSIIQRLTKRHNPPQTVALRQQIGTVTEEVVADVQFGLVGGDKKSAIELHWNLSAPLDGNPPTYDELIALGDIVSKPSPPKRDTGLFEVVRGQPVYYLSNVFADAPGKQSGFNGAFPASIRSKAEEKLIQAGFALKKTFDNPEFESQQFMWHRYRDETYANITRMSDPNQIRFNYAPPRREQRQTISIEDLSFETPNDRDLLQAFIDHADRLAQPGWTQDKFGGWKNTDYFASWRSTQRYED